MAETDAVMETHNNQLTDGRDSDTNGVRGGGSGNGSICGSSSVNGVNSGSGGGAGADGGSGYDGSCDLH